MNPDTTRLVVTEEEWKLLNDVASEPDRIRQCISVHSVPVYVKRDGEIIKAPAGPVWGTDLEYTGE